MTVKQKTQFNQMLDTLRHISKDYQTLEQLKKNEGQYGLSFEEEISMAYENIQLQAKSASRGIRKILV